jgi:hypothetical protein
VKLCPLVERGANQDEVKPCAFLPQQESRVPHLADKIKKSVEALKETTTIQERFVYRDMALVHEQDIIEYLWGRYKRAETD